MKLMIRGLNIDVTPAIKTHITEKSEAIEDHLDAKHASLAEFRIEVGKTTKHHYKGNVFYAEGNFKIGKNLFRATNTNEDLYTAINHMCDEISRQIRKLKTKEISKHRASKK